jgi:hypothetical protein
MRSRLPQFLKNWLRDSGEVVSLTRLPAALYPEEDSYYSFLLEAESKNPMTSSGIEPAASRLVT